MRKLFFYRIGILAMFLLPFQVSSQNTNATPGDIQFGVKAYDLAIKSFESQLSEKPGDLNVMTKLALSYERTNNLLSAARLFDEIVSSPGATSFHNLSYGKVLMKLGLYDQARVQFEKLSKINIDYAKHLVNATEFAKFGPAMDEEFIIKEVIVSSESDDFGPALWGSKLVYNSFDDEKSSISLIQRKASDLYITFIAREGMTKPVKMGNDFTNLSGIGPVRFSADGKKAVFTRNDFVNGMQQIVGNEKDMSIYIADVDDICYFYNEMPLTVNGMDHSTAFACFGRDENEVFFSSNKGQDNFDLYVIRYENGSWTEAIPLDGNINSPGNEITPYFDGETLYFSSDYHSGFGGYDIFKTSLYKDEWSFPMNLGKGINSPADDLYYITMPGGVKSFFASNRLGTRGGLDIFSATPGKITRNEEIAYQNAPVPVKLSSLEETQSIRIADTESRTVSMSGASYLSVASLEGARMIAYDDVIITPSDVYFIQLASLASSSVNSAIFRDLTRFGDIYKVKEGGLTKVRLGYFISRSEAVSVLASVKKAGYRDAFIVQEYLNTSKLELMESSYTFTNTQKYEKPESVGSYKIKLAAYTNPLYFDVNKVKDIGVVEQWSKGQWTIFMLSGYKDYNDANQAMLKARNRGFSTAEIVIDDAGILSPVRNQ